jgi:hypothetical protein
MGKPAGRNERERKVNAFGAADLSRGSLCESGCELWQIPLKIKNQTGEAIIPATLLGKSTR